MMKSASLLIFVFMLTVKTFAQSGGNNTYEFLNLSSSARLASMGGSFVSVMDNDPVLSFSNPALLNQKMNNGISLSYVPYFADIKYGYAAYAKHFQGIGTFSGGMHYVDYGSFTEADEAGNITGTFSAGEYSFNIGYARPVYERVSAGITLKTIYSKLESYHSWGMAADAGVHYSSESGNFSTGLVLKNAGMQFTTYTKENREPLPFEIQAGLSYLLPKAPLRLSITLQHLEKWNLTYTDPSKALETDPITGKPAEVKISFAEKALRHLIFGGEILLSENMHLRFAYNYMRRKDLALETRKSIAGFSGGFGFRISKFHLSYGRAAYHVAGGANYFTVTSFLGDFSKKTSVREKE